VGGGVGLTGVAGCVAEIAGVSAGGERRSSGVRCPRQKITAAITTARNAMTIEIRSIHRVVAAGGGVATVLPEGRLSRCVETTV
jgi:hypothetical protein